jgi:hypothetical protein
VKDNSSRPQLPEEIAHNWRETETDLRRREYYQQLTQRYDERLKRYEEAAQFYTEVCFIWFLIEIYFSFSRRHKKNWWMFYGFPMVVGCVWRMRKW